LYGSLELSDLRRGSLVIPMDQKAELTLIISGPVDISSCIVFEAYVSHYVSECNADSLLRKSWTDEKISAKITKPTAHYVDCASDCRLLHLCPNWPRLDKIRFTLVDLSKTRNERRMFYLKSNYQLREVTRP